MSQFFILFIYLFFCVLDASFYSSLNLVQKTICIKNSFPEYGWGWTVCLWAFAWANIFLHLWLFLRTVFLFLRTKNTKTSFGTLITYCLHYFPCFQNVSFLITKKHVSFVFPLFREQKELFPCFQSFVLTFPVVTCEIILLCLIFSCSRTSINIREYLISFVSISPLIFLASISCKIRFASINAIINPSFYYQIPFLGIIQNPLRGFDQKIKIVEFSV